MKLERQSLLPPDFRRGANCHADQIVIMGGMQQLAMLACALALINEGEVAWIEDPVFHQARNVLAFVGAKTITRLSIVRGW